MDIRGLHILQLCCGMGSLIPPLYPDLFSSKTKLACVFPVTLMLYFLGVLSPSLVTLLPRHLSLGDLSLLLSDQVSDNQDFPKWKDVSVKILPDGSGLTTDGDLDSF